MVFSICQKVIIGDKALVFDELVAEAAQDNIDRIIGMSNLLGYTIKTQYVNEEDIRELSIVNIDFIKDNKELNLDFYINKLTNEVQKIEAWINDRKQMETKLCNNDEFLNLLHSFYFMIE